MGWTAFAYHIGGFEIPGESRAGIVGGPFVVVGRRPDSKMNRVAVAGCGCNVVEFDRIAVVDLG